MPIRTASGHAMWEAGDWPRDRGEAGARDRNWDPPTHTGVSATAAGDFLARRRRSRRLGHSGVGRTGGGPPQGTTGRPGT